MNNINRQSRFLGMGKWHDRGNVTLEEAAIEHYRNSIVVPESGSAIEVRDAAEPDQIWVLTVTPKVTYEVEGLRGGDNG